MTFMLHSISPVDGRYADKTSSLQPYFSEAALMRYRVSVEIDYLIAMLETGVIKTHTLTDVERSALKNVVRNFSDEDALRIKSIESKINHDVKAIEYFVKEKLDALHLDHLREWVHFGLTSQDINNTAFPLMIKAAYQEEVIPSFKSARQAIFEF